MKRSGFGSGGAADLVFYKIVRRSGCTGSTLPTRTSQPDAQGCRLRQSAEDLVIPRCPVRVATSGRYAWRSCVPVSEAIGHGAIGTLLSMIAAVAAPYDLAISSTASRCFSSRPRSVEPERASRPGRPQRRRQDHLSSHHRREVADRRDLVPAHHRGTFRRRGGDVGRAVLDKPSLAAARLRIAPRDSRLHTPWPTPRAPRHGRHHRRLDPRRQGGAGLSRQALDKPSASNRRAAVGGRVPLRAAPR